MGRRLRERGVLEAHDVGRGARAAPFFELILEKSLMSPR